MDELNPDTDLGSEADPELADPLADYRQDVQGTMEAIEEHAAQRGERVLEVFGSGGPPVALTDQALWLSNESEVYRLPREAVQALGQIRSTDYVRMRWGVGLYLVALVGLFFHWLITGVLAIVGGALVVFGFLAKALLVQIEDERVPPFVVDHRRWKAIRDRLEAWKDGSRAGRS